MLRKYLFVIGLVLVVISSHLAWFNPNSIIQFGDWQYRPDEHAIQGLTSWSTWIGFEDFGSPNPIVFGYPLRGILWSIVVRMGLTYDIATKVTLLIPIAICGFLVPYFVLLRFGFGRISSFVSALIYGSCPYFLILQTGHFPIAFIYSIAPLFFYFNHEYLVTSKPRYWFYLVLLLLFSSAYDLRIIIIIGSLLIFQFFFHFIFRETMPTLKNIVYSFLIVGIYLAGSSYWAFPMLKGLMNEISTLTDRGLFGDNLFSLINAFTVMKWNWTGGVPDWTFTRMPVLNYLWVIPLFAFSSLLYFRRIIRKKEYASTFITFIFFTLLGVFLTKQSSVPFTGFYIWMYKNFPSFNIFREASKFYLITSLGYLFLIAFFLEYNMTQLKKKWKYLFVVMLLIVVAFLNLSPFLSQKIKTTFVSSSIPDDYVVYNNYLKNDKAVGYYRTYWVPVFERWALYNETMPRVSIASMNDRYYRKVLNATTWSSDPDGRAEGIMQSLSLDISDAVIDSTSIRYVIVPIIDSKNFNIDFYKYFGEKNNPNVRQWYIDQLDELPFLKRIEIGTKDLVIYENQNYLPHFHSMSSLLQYDSFQNLDPKYLFSLNTSSQSFDFIVPNEKDVKNIPTLDTHLMFENLEVKSFDNDSVSQRVQSDGKDSSVYIDVGKRVIEYTTQKNKITFFSDSQKNLFADSNLIEKSSDSRQIASVSFNQEEKYFAGIGSRLVSLESSSKKKLLDVLTKPFNLLSSNQSINLIPDGSFSQGAWQDKVGDCNAYDDQGLLGMTVVQDGNEGGNALELRATSHIACTGPGAQKIDGGKKYFFSFDYQSPNGKQAGYYMSFNNDKGTVLNEKLSVANSGWQHFQKAVDVPEDATSFKLVVYSYSLDNKTSIVTRYRNFAMIPLTKVATIDPQYKQNFQKIELPKQDFYNFTYRDLNHDFPNLIYDSSFENGLWSDTVGDCNAYDNNGEVGIALSDVALDGSKSLELQATRHIACTGPGVLPAVEDKTYFFSFDYQSPNGKNAGYYLGFNDPNHTVISERLSINDKEWHTFNKQIKIPQGASSVSLAVYSYSVDGKTNIITRYDNFHFVQLPDLENRYYVVSDPQTNFVDPNSIEFDLLNPTKKLVHIKGATTPFYLAMSESYHPQWQAQMNNDKINGKLAGWVPWVKPDRIADDKHFELNGFLNGWFVEPAELCSNENSACTLNPDGSYDMEMTIEFFPQRWFYLGLLISGTTLAGCLGYLGYDFIKRRKNRKIETTEIITQK